MTDAELRELQDDLILLSDLMEVIREAFPNIPELVADGSNFAERVRRLFSTLWVNPFSDDDAWRDPLHAGLTRREIPKC